MGNVAKVQTVKKVVTNLRSPVIGVQSMKCVLRESAARKCMERESPVFSMKIVGILWRAWKDLSATYVLKKSKTKTKTKKIKNWTKKKGGNTHGKLQLPRKPSQVANRIRFMDKLPSLVKVEAKLILVDLAKL